MNAILGYTLEFTGEFEKLYAWVPTPEILIYLVRIETLASSCLKHSTGDYNVQ